MINLFSGGCNMVFRFFFRKYVYKYVDKILVFISLNGLNGLVFYFCCIKLIFVIKVLVGFLF